MQPGGIHSARFSTHGVEPRLQFDAFREEVSPRFGIADVSRKGSGPFAAEMETVSLGPVSLSVIATDAMTFERAASHVSRRSRDEFTVGLLTKGTAIVEQDGRAARVGPNDLVVCDGRRPYRLHFGEPFHQIVYHCDRRQLEARLPDVEKRTALRIASKDFVPRAATGYVRALLGSSAPLGTEAIVAQHLLDVLSAALDKESEPAESVILARVRDFIERNLQNPWLDPAMIAQRHHISLRYLYRLFGATGTTVAAFVRERRLMRSRVLLLADASSTKTIGDIAFSAGFKDPTTFGRAFREAFGVTPREYRQSVSQGRGAGPGLHAGSGQAEARASS
jgi:AraC-like DNA-binding protein